MKAVAVAASAVAVGTAAGIVLGVAAYILVCHFGHGDGPEFPY